MVNALHDLGADVNVQSSNGDTPGHAAAYQGDTMMLETLHDLGADLCICNDDGDTPAHKVP